jgi:hypothetical protein
LPLPEAPISTRTIGRMALAALSAALTLGSFFVGIVDRAA